MVHGIPTRARRVFKGVIFDVWQWEQELFDGSKVAFERLSRPDSVCVLPVHDGKIVVGVEEQPASSKFSTLIAGRLDSGLSPLEHAKRELREEAGLASDDWELFRVYEHQGKVAGRTHVFVARGCRKVGEQSLDAGERIELRECSFEEFLDFVAREDFRFREFALDLFRMRLDEKKLEVLRKRLLAA